MGVRSITLVEPRVPDVLNPDPGTHAPPLKDRKLVIEIWYPALPNAKTRAQYEGSLPSQAAGQRATFTFAGIAGRDAPADRHETYPLVILSHGYSGTPIAMSWPSRKLGV